MSTPRRVVTGHTGDGVSVVLSDGPIPVSRELPADGVSFHEVWNTEGAPARITAVEPNEPTERTLAVPPPSLGTKIRINEFALATSTSADCSHRSTAPPRSTTASCSRARSRSCSTTPR